MNHRKYDIGSGVIIVDDGHHLLAKYKIGENGSGSIGVRRPPGPLPESLACIFSQSGALFYVINFAIPIHGWWLGVKPWTYLEELQTHNPKSYAHFTSDDGDRYYRELIHFSMWDVKAQREPRDVPTSNQMIKDYLALVQNDDREQEKRFNDAIAFSGRNLKWIIDRIGHWVPLPPEPPPIVLTD